ncbi:YeeE/YedE family protein [Burkholderiaceae bacterium UC74_6]
MHTDWIHFTPWASLIGGLLIGLAAVGLALLNGRIAGISGIVAGLLKPQAGEWPWRLAFVVGLLASALLMARPTIRIDADTPTLIIAGLLVGFGTRLGSGCTSGHGVCGLSRLSLRSLAATGLFMASAIVTVYIVRHV